MDTRTTLIWSVIAFISGAMPLSLWLGQLALGVDIRAYGDGNPGAFNVWRAGGKWWGITAILLDFFKGCLPVVIVQYGLGLGGYGLTAVAFAPILGHAVSPFLRFRGGKALAVTFGVWAGLTIWLAPTILGLAFAFWLALVIVEGWAVMLGMGTLLLALFLIGTAPEIIFLWGLNFIVLFWKHAADFRRSPLQRLRKRASS
jgi:glycerol-3-phosphate acyltransferase PlsY